MSVIGSPSNLSVLAAWPSLMSLIHRSIIRRNRRVMAYVTPPSILSCDSCPLLFFFFPRSSTRVAYWGVYSLSSTVECERNFEIGYLGTLAGNVLWNSCNYAVQEFLNGQTWLGEFFLGKYLDSSKVARKSKRSRVDKRICERVLPLCVRMNGAEIFLRGKIRKRLIWPYLTVDRY